VGGGCRIALTLGEEHLHDRSHLFTLMRRDDRRGWWLSNRTPTLNSQSRWSVRSLDGEEHLLQLALRSPKAAPVGVAGPSMARSARRIWLSQVGAPAPFKPQRGGSTRPRGDELVMSQCTGKAPGNRRPLFSFSRDKGAELLGAGFLNIQRLVAHPGNEGGIR
jgi:hypothetical protein